MVGGLEATPVPTWCGPEGLVPRLGTTGDTPCYIQGATQCGDQMWDFLRVTNAPLSFELFLQSQEVIY